MIGVCLLLASLIHLHSSAEAKVDRSQMEVILRGQLKRKQLGPVAFQSLLNDKFPWRNSSAADRIGLMTDLLDTLNRLEVRHGQERISISLSLHICTNLNTEYGKLNESRRELSCPYYFDKMSCWPPTRAGTFAEAKCPGYVPFMTSNATVQIFCNLSGTWEYQPKNVNEFCDLYAVCHLDDCLERHQKSKQPPSRPFQAALDVLRYCSTCGYGCSIVATAMAIGVFIYIRCMHCARNKVHLNLFVAFFLRGVFTVAVFSGAVESNSASTSKKELVDAYGCRAVATLWQYFYVASYSWMFVEGLYLHNIIYFHVFRETNIFPYFILGWGLPLVVISVWVAVKSLLDNFGCWIVYHYTPYMWVLMGPISALFIINFCLFVNVIRALLTKLNSANVSAAGKYRRLLKSTVILVFVFGVHYFFLILPINWLNKDQQTLPMVICLYVENIPNSLQGFIVAFTYCLYNSEVRLEVRRRWNRFQQQKLGLTSTQTSTVGAAPMAPLNGHSNVSQAELERKIAKLPKGTARKFQKNLLRVRLEFDHSPLRSDCNTAVSTMPSSATSTLSRKQRDPPRQTEILTNGAGHLLPPKIHFGAESPGGAAGSDLNRSLLAPEDPDDDDISQEAKGDDETPL